MHPLSRTKRPCLARALARQRGAALIITVVLVAAGIAIVAAGLANEVTRSQQSELNTGLTLAQAKDALIARAVAHPTHPGALPCPDTDNDGEENAPVAGACPSYIGRLPWRTLGIDDLRDENGERLWYALSPNFRDAGSVQINSDAKGDRIVYSGSSALTLTAQAVAVIFAPGAALGGQVRASTMAICANTGTSIARSLCAVNYLESIATADNASASGPYISARPGASFNDRLIVLRTADLMPLVERRVAADLRQVLVQYRDRSGDAILAGGCNCYPWADNDKNGTSDTGNNRGRIPLTALPHNWGTVLTDSATGIAYPALPTLPPYFQVNGWANVVYYAVGRNALENFGLAPTACTTCTVDPAAPPPTLLLGTLSLNDTIGHAVVLITPGSAGASRPSNTWGDYIDDASNNDDDDRFVTPVSKAFDRDRIHTIPDDAPPASCSPNAKILIENAPCHTTGFDVKPICRKAASNLAYCSCSTAGTAMISAPCQNTLNPQACKTAVDQLQACVM